MRSDVGAEPEPHAIEGDRGRARRRRVWLVLVMRSSEVHALDDQDLVERLREARQEAFNLRFRHATGELEDTAKIGAARRDVARLLTVARQRGIDLDKELR